MTTQINSFVDSVEKNRYLSGANFECILVFSCSDQRKVVFEASTSRFFLLFSYQTIVRAQAMEKLGKTLSDRWQFQVINKLKWEGEKKNVIA